MDSGFDALHRPGMTVSFVAHLRILAQQKCHRGIENGNAQRGRRECRAISSPAASYAK
jgi:hypothetical protein